MHELYVSWVFVLLTSENSLRDRWIISADEMLDLFGDGMNLRV